MKLRILELNKHNFYGNMVSKPKGDAGIDLYFPNDVNVPARQSLLIDFEIQCEMWTWTKIVVTICLLLKVLTTLTIVVTNSYQEVVFGEHQYDKQMVLVL